MSSFRAIALSCFAVAVMAAPQASITEDVSSTAIPTGVSYPVTFPGGLDQQVLVGSVISASNGVATIDVTCPEGTDSDDCGFFPAVAVTAGPNTLALTLSGTHESDGVPYTYVQACSFDASAGGACTFTDIDAAYNIEMDSSVDTATATGIVSTTYTSDIAATDLSTINVVLTAGQTAALTGLASATATGGSESSGPSTGTATRGQSSAAVTGTRSSSSSGTAAVTGASSSSTSSNDAKALVPGALAAGLMGLAAVLL